MKRTDRIPGRKRREFVHESGVSDSTMNVAPIEFHYRDRPAYHPAGHGNVQSAHAGKCAVGV
ncbi:hypothetical protein, partial [Stenotrophomonas pavanii]|uniref:hypothetical protein n=1 Tax=Stenotrophomonas pavanii TaxID=487698 RepID=UPI0039C5E346